MKKKVLDDLKVNLPFLSPTETKLARLILDDPKKVISCSMAELSALANVSQGSICNFAKKFAGCGFSDLKLQIASELSHYEPQPLSVAEESDGVREVLKKTVRNHISALENTILANSEEVLASAADKILHAGRVEIYGVYRSAAMASNIYYKLLVLGIPASFVGDTLSCAVSASMLERDCVIIAVSSSGTTKDVTDAVKLAKSRGVPIICITSNKNSPLAQLSDDVLVSPSGGNSVEGQDNEVRIAQMTLFDALCSYLLTRIDKDGSRYLGLRDILNSHRVND